MRKKLVIAKQIGSIDLNDINVGKFRKLEEECGASIMSEIPKMEYPPVPYFQLYKYATNADKLSILVGIILGLATGVCLTLVNHTFGKVTGVIVEYVTIMSNTTNKTKIDNAKMILLDGVVWFVIYNCILGSASFLFNYLSTVLFSYSAIKQTFRIRKLFLQNVLNQDVSWYDVQQTGDFASRIADDLRKIEEGIGEKVSIFVFYMAVFVANIFQALIVGWELALICLISFPLSAISMGFVAWISTNLAKQEIEAYGGAGAIAEETLSSIRTVIAFAGQQNEEKRYNDLLLFARNNNIKRSLFNSISNGIMWFFTYGSFAIAFWYGVKLILKERHLSYAEITYNPGTMITVFFSVLTGLWYFGMASPYIETFGIARGAAAKIFTVIASEPIINASKGKGLKPRKLNGNITFKGVYFSYPSRPDVKVLRGLTFAIKAGETVALVGSSGCGKSTCVQLLQRFYDPIEGDVFLDDNSISELDLSWLRARIGVVGQEPILFETTIAENIKFGCPTATRDDIEQAAKKANAHGFIKLLPNGYNTMVGERGAQLSGGQKQRVAIARALVREPSILLLDEATSALDTNSEAIVQAALDEASNECTTVIVAHRLSTVRKADRIVVITEGAVVEEGTHDELVLAKGAYFKLITAQMSPGDDSATVTATAEDEFPFINQQHLEEMDRKLSTRLSIGSAQANLEADMKKSTTSSLWVVMKYNSPEWWLITIGCLSSIVTGAMMPIYSIIFGDLLGVLSHEDPDHVRNETNTFCLYFLIIGIASGIATFFQMYTFGIAGEKLTMRLRSKMFKAMMSQELSWFDDKDNGVGSLCARLSGEAASVQGATGQRIGTVLNALSTIIIAMATSLYFEWRISLVALCFTPPIVFSIYMEQKLMTKESQGQHSALLNSTKLAVEAISNIRTVASLGCERLFYERYIDELKPYQNSAKRNTHFRGIVYGFSRSLMFFSYAAALYYGVTLIINENLNYAIVFIVSESLITSSWSIANALAFTPNFQKGLISANRIFELLSRTSKIQDGSNDVDEKWAKGDINYNGVRFTYSTRPDTEVLKGLDLSILQGKMVALVGPSGCGKSTIVQLLERFYDPSHGSISADGKNIRRMNLSALRSHFGIVSQEPNLFSKTLAENIAYGDTTRNVPMDEIISAAKKANIHNFIKALPLGYDTKLGDKGTQLSGGQKQRVAIARALIRNPKVLLLDEATSALDAESEKIVQDALDNAMKGRTCISIAHRLTTIQDADVICVINHGKLVEIGTHSSLLSIRGVYYNLHRLQKGICE